jgi:hypothetical protein
MRNDFFPSRFQLLHCVIQKKVYQDSINFSLGMLTQDLPTDQLHTPNTAASQLNLPSRPTLNQLLLTNGKVQLRTVHQTAEGTQDLRYAVIRKHGDLVDVPKFAVALAFKAGPEISDENLGSLEELHTLAVLKAKLVVETAKGVGQEVYQGSSGVGAGGDAVCETARVFL